MVYIGSNLIKPRCINFTIFTGDDKRFRQGLLFKGNNFPQLANNDKVIHTLSCTIQNSSDVEAEAAIFCGSGSGKHEMNGSGSGSSKKILEAEAEAIKITSLV